jgi:hypothetical protein
LSKEMWDSPSNVTSIGSFFMIISLCFYDTNKYKNIPADFIQRVRITALSLVCV